MAIAGHAKTPDEFQEGPKIAPKRPPRRPQATSKHAWNALLASTVHSAPSTHNPSTVPVWAEGH